MSILSFGTAVVPHYTAPYAEASILTSIVEFAKLSLVCTSFLALAFMVLLALPQSRLRAVFLQVLSWLGVAAAGVYVASPFDLIPDFIPIVGWFDDVGAVIGGVFCYLTALSQRQELARLAREAEAAAVAEPRAPIEGEATAVKVIEERT